MRPTTKNVSGCTVCPFASDGTNMDPGFGWTCHAEYTREGWPRKLGIHPAASPPRWCPLRKAPIVVVLTKRKP